MSELKEFPSCFNLFIISGTKNRSKGKKPLHALTKEILKTKLKEEQEFYDFVRQTFHERSAKILG